MCTLCWIFPKHADLFEIKRSSAYQRAPPFWAMESVRPCVCVCVCVCMSVCVGVCVCLLFFHWCSNRFWLHCQIYIYINILCSRPIFGLLGFTVKQNWAEVTDFFKKLYEKRPWRNEKENKNKNLNKKWATVWPTTAQPSLAPKNWVQPAVIKSKLHVGHKCVVVEHTAETIFIYASKTLDAELD